MPRQDGTPRRVDYSLDQFHGDLDRLGIPRQRQYESRATFRTLALDGGADNAQIDAITHPRLVTGPDFYRRLERGWGARCAAILAIPAAAWELVKGEGEQPAADEVTAEVTAYGAKLKTPCNWTRLQGVQMVTPTGLEPMSST